MDDLTRHRKRRLRELLDSPSYKGSQAALAGAIGKTESYVSQLANPDRYPFGELTARRIAQALRLDDRYFESGFGSSEPLRPAPLPARAKGASAPFVDGAANDDFVSVHRADVKFSNGHGYVNFEEDEHPPLVFRADFLRKMGIAKGDAVVVESAGHSNEPRIPDGAVVLVNRGDKERLDGDFFAFRVDGELLIKRLQKLDGIGVLATAENPNFKPKQRVYENAIDFEVIGRAVWTGALL